MRDPEPLISSNGITDFERELLGAAKNEPVPDALREQMERALGLAGGAGAGAGLPRTARAEGVVGVKAATVLWVSAGVIALGFLGGILGARFVDRNAPAPRAALSVAAPEAPTSESVPSASVSASASASAIPSRSPVRAPVAAPPAPPAAPGDARVLSRPVATGMRATAEAAPSSSEAPSGSVARGAAAVARPRAHAHGIAKREPKLERDKSARETIRREPRPAGNDLRGEIDLIDGARGALRTGTATHALELLGRYAARFPHGSLAPEGTALRVEALMRSGRAAEGRALARRFIAANPASPLVERMESLVRAPDQAE